MSLHDLEELDDDLGAGSDQDLTLSSLLGVVDALKSIVQNGGADHLAGGIGSETVEPVGIESLYLLKLSSQVSLPRL